MLIVSGLYPFYHYSGFFFCYLYALALFFLNSSLILASVASSRILNLFTSDLWQYCFPPALCSIAGLQIWTKEPRDFIIAMRTLGYSFCTLSIQTAELDAESCTESKGFENLLWFHCCLIFTAGLCGQARKLGKAEFQGNSCAISCWLQGMVVKHPKELHFLQSTGEMRRRDKSM